MSCKEIEGWDSLQSVGINPIEIEMILKMDSAFLVSTLKEHEAVKELARSKEANKPRSKRP